MVRGTQHSSTCSAAYGCLWPPYGQEEKADGEEEEEELVVSCPQSFTLCFFGSEASEAHRGDAMP